MYGFLNYSLFMWTQNVPLQISLKCTYGNDQADLVEIIIIFIQKRCFQNVLDTEFIENL